MTSLTRNSSFVYKQTTSRSGRLYLLYLKTEFHKTPLLTAVEEFVHEQITNKFKFHLKELVSMNVIASVLMPTRGKPSRSTYIVKGSRKKLVLRIHLRRISKYHVILFIDTPQKQEGNMQYIKKVPS
ncbi:uncharacterized protein LOC134225353 [Armigeres subalbatus]|uniref:uncharacterized protein LOC134225353 n=1 Tax=Armigeres subalbatus TaxID=124917 RepID=UPI002ED578F3